MNYDEADKAIKAINRDNLKTFSRLKLAKWDELSVIREVTAAYNTVLRRVKKWFLDVALLAYMAAMEEAGRKGTERQARRAINDDWILAMLEETDPVLLYKFIPELERKKQRLIEALPVALDRNKEIDGALRAVSKQIGWSIINVVDAATVEAYEDAKVDYVQWVSEHDARVCDVCEDMDGNVYVVSKVPPKPHPACRCRIRPYKP